VPDKDPADGIAAAAFDLADRVRKLTLELQTTKGGLEETSRQLNDVSQNRDKIQRHLREAEQLAQDRGRLNEILERDVNTWKRKAEAVRLDPVEQENARLRLRVGSLEKDMEERVEQVAHHRQDAAQWKQLAEDRDRDIIAAAETHATAAKNLQKEIDDLLQRITKLEEITDFRKREHAELYVANNHNLSEAVEWKQKAKTLQQQVIDLTKERDVYEVTLSNRVESYFETDVLNAVAKKMHKIADDHGFHEGYEKFPTVAGLVDDRFGEWIANLHGEVSELWEAFRKDTWHMLCDKQINGVSIGLTCAEEEFADTIIRAMESAVSMNINIGKAIYVKANYNNQRAYRHGNKKA
jgi:hypothetical protein